MKPTLLVLAAGVGSRYGGLKQIDPFGPAGEVIMDYSVYDAVRAGFGKVVFVIRRDFEQQFKDKVAGKYARRITVDYAFQELADLPDGFAVPEGRVKPWGTAHAILVARGAINEPFAMLNADDFYGRDSFAKIGALLQTTDPQSADWCMVGYKIGNTLSEFGGVTRAMCDMDNGFLKSIVERFEIRRQGGNVVTHDKAGNQFEVTPDALTSMNLFGFTPRLFDLLQDGFIAFLRKNGQDLKSEYLIPSAVNEIIAAGNVRMKVLTSDSSWFGVTYPDDKPRVQESIRKLVAAGAYPSPLWE
jgi:NDP-sugar pyrophosphorylase family protein